MKTVYNRVAAFRKYHGLTQSQLGKLCHCSQNTISALETVGAYNCSIQLALRLQDVFQVPLHEIFTLHEWGFLEEVQDVYSRKYSSIDCCYCIAQQEKD